ncbi:MAG: zinc ribbon domain-containing protein, partial [Acidobacteria bacterium]|nr:zinc ribbon domain-containing protein [Acidobacteriota bacterium]
IERIGLRPARHTKSARKPDRPAAQLGASEAVSKPKREHSTAASGKNICSSCKSSNPPGNRFCGQCGQPLTP